jgi:hypothetical protein
MHVRNSLRSSLEEAIDLPLRLLHIMLLRLRLVLLLLLRIRVLVDGAEAIVDLLSSCPAWPSGRTVHPESQVVGYQSPGGRHV